MKNGRIVEMCGASGESKAPREQRWPLLPMIESLPESFRIAQVERGRRVEIDLTVGGIVICSHIDLTRMGEAGERVFALCLYKG